MKVKPLGKQPGKNFVDIKPGETFRLKGSALILLKLDRAVVDAVALFNGKHFAIDEYALCEVVHGFFQETETEEGNG